MRLTPTSSSSNSKNKSTPRPFRILFLEHFNYRNVLNILGVAARHLGSASRLEIVIVDSVQNLEEKVKTLASLCLPAASATASGIAGDDATNMMFLHMSVDDYLNEFSSSTSPSSSPSLAIHDNYFDYIEFNYGPSASPDFEQTLRRLDKLVR